MSRWRQKHFSIRFGASLAVLGLLFVTNVVLAVPIVYDVDRMHENKPQTVSGTITTDGTIGVVTEENIIDWRLKLSHPWGSLGDELHSIVLDKTNSRFVGRISASPHELFFEWLPSGGFFALAGEDNWEWIIRNGGQQEPNHTDERLLHLSGAEVYDRAFGFGEWGEKWIIGTARPTAVPEPVSLALMSIGLVVLVFARRYRRKAAVNSVVGGLFSDRLVAYCSRDSNRVNRMTGAGREHPSADPCL